MENERELLRFGWRLDSLDDWRKDVDGRVAVLESLVNDLKFSDAVAEALAQKLAARQRLDWTVLQKIGAGAFALFLVIAPTVIAKVLG